MLQLIHPRHLSVNPLVQAFYCFVFFLILTAAGLAMLKMGDWLPDSRFLPWFSGASMVLLYVFASTMNYLRANDTKIYYQRANMGFIALAVVSGFVAYFVSGLSLNEAGFYSRIYIVLTFGFLLLMSMMRFMRYIMGVAEKEDHQIQKQMEEWDTRK
jgi:hypothetical protein